QRFLQLTLEAQQELGHACALERCEQCAIAHLLAEPRVPELRAAAAVRDAPTPLPRTRFTGTNNLIPPLPPPPFTAASPHVPVVFHSLNLSRVAFVLENVLSPAECAHLIAASEGVGYHTLAGEFVPSMRDNDRALLMSAELAQVVYARIEPFFTRDPRTAGLRPFGWNSRGTWRPDRHNPLFRFCVYRAPAIGFTPHRDSNFVGGENDRCVRE